MRSTITEQLWGFTPELIGDDRRAFFIWSWRKLVLAGLMICSLIFSLCIRFSNIVIASITFSCTLLLWVCGLNIFWFWYLLPEVVHRESTQSSSQIKTDPSERSEWSGKIRDKSDPNCDFRLPVTVITGYLGSGKTTLVSHILKNTLGLKILVIENEIGEEGIDHELLVQVAKEDIILLNNGCVCCKVRNDLIQTFHALFGDPKLSQLDWIVIETTGLADPGPLIQSLYHDDQCKRHLRLDSIITVVDAKHFESHITCDKNAKPGIHGDSMEAVQQICFADRVILNKTDLVGGAESARVIATIKGMNPRVEVIRSMYAQVPVDELLNLRAFDASRNPSLLEEPVSTSMPVFIKLGKNGEILSSKKERQLQTTVSTLSLTVEAPLDLDRFNSWITSYLARNGSTVYRVKGVIRRMLFH
jgi:G3E family GTPase